VAAWDSKPRLYAAIKEYRRIEVTEILNITSLAPLIEDWKRSGGQTPWRWCFGPTLLRNHSNNLTLL